MASTNEEAGLARNDALDRISSIRAARLRVALDEVRGRTTPAAVVRMAQLTPPRLPSPLTPWTRRMESSGLIRSHGENWLSTCVVSFAPRS